jgi:ComF family protein
MEFRKIIKNFLLDLFFPKFCLGCQREGDYLCPDCKSILDINQNHQKFKMGHLSDLYFITEYKNFLIKKLIQYLKYEPFCKELAKDLSLLIIDHFQLIDKEPEFLKNKKDWVLIPVPLEKRKIKWRGYNQAEEIAKNLSQFLKIPLLSNCLIKIKKTRPQVELSLEERKENVKGAFLVKNEKLIKNKKILLVDDVFTTGATMLECARILKEAGVKEIVGIVIARAHLGQDK